MEEAKGQDQLQERIVKESMQLQTYRDVRERETAWERACLEETKLSRRLEKMRETQEACRAESQRCAGALKEMPDLEEVSKELVKGRQEAEARHQDLMEFLELCNRFQEAKKAAGERTGTVS